MLISLFILDIFTKCICVRLLNKRFSVNILNERFICRWSTCLCLSGTTLCDKKIFFKSTSLLDYNYPQWKRFCWKRWFCLNWTMFSLFDRCYAYLFDDTDSEDVDLNEAIARSFLDVNQSQHTEWVNVIVLYRQNKWGYTLNLNRWIKEVNNQL